MIVLDIETSGINPEKHGIWQIDALELENPNNNFLEEGRIDNEDEITDDSIKVHGKNEEYLRNINNQSQKTLIETFFKWSKNTTIITAVCQNPHFDLGFIKSKAGKYGLINPLHHRAYDLHSIASLKYYQVNGRFLIEENHSGMGLTKILKFCGIEDRRKAHNALEDAKLAAECFSRLAYGKSHLPEYNRFSIPIELTGARA